MASREPGQVGNLVLPHVTGTFTLKADSAHPVRPREQRGNSKESRGMSKDKIRTTKGMARKTNAEARKS